MVHFAGTTIYHANIPGPAQVANRGQTPAAVRKPLQLYSITTPRIAEMV
jgi:hypothetical protein